jgi:hypothetical protein
MPTVVQAQNDEIGFESVGSQQDLFTRCPVLDHKFRLDSRLGRLQIQSIELPLASHSRLVSHLREIAGGRPMKTLRYLGHRENVEHNEFCAEMIGERDGVGQSMQGSRPEIRRKQKGANWLNFLHQGILVRTWTHGRDKTISVTKDLFRYRAEEQLA